MQNETCCVRACVNYGQFVIFLYLSHMRKTILKAPMFTFKAGLDVLNLARVFITIRTKCKQASNALVSLKICTDTSEPSLLEYAIRTKIVLCLN